MESLKGDWMELVSKKNANNRNDCWRNI